MDENQFAIFIQELQFHKTDICEKLEGIRCAIIDVTPMKLKELKAIPRWRCKSCRRLYKKYDDAVNCCHR